jgi:hypothetical protein
LNSPADKGSFKLSNIVEVDETYIGGKEKNKHASKKLNMGETVFWLKSLCQLGFVCFFGFYFWIG